MAKTKGFLMEKDLSQQIVESAIEVHRLLGGPGLLETIYESALCHELSLRGIPTQRQMQIPVTYKNKVVRDPLFLDILEDVYQVRFCRFFGSFEPIFEFFLRGLYQLAYTTPAKRIEKRPK